jgi:NTP pyrophosphatase (non-canonical NTP hydrolase)
VDLAQAIVGGAEDQGMEFAVLVQRALEVRQQYAEWERRRYGRPWSREEVALGLAGDVGDLMKLVQAQEGVRDIPDAKDKLAHELADCLWSVLVLADLYDVELEQAFLQTMDELEAHLSR